MEKETIACERRIICREDRVTNARSRGIGEHIQLEIAAG